MDGYSKVVPVVQSSGARKSRLLDRYGAERVGIIYTIRGKEELEYPPGDPEVAGFLGGSVEGLSIGKKRATEHAKMVCLLAATVKAGQFGVYVSTVFMGL